MKKVRILSIDGGGIRGILPGVILTYIEEQLQLKSGNPHARLADYFDMMAGTSTGGILCCLYLCPDEFNRPRYSASEAVNLYMQHGNEIFSRKLGHRLGSVGGITDERYSAEALEKAMDKYFGKSMLSELLKPILITSYDIESRKAHFFTSHDADSDLYDFLVTDVARATSAAPTYFECASVRSLYGSPYALIDGGVFVNNPALCAYSEARNMNFETHGIQRPKARDMVILSIGTGSHPTQYSYDKAKDWGMVQWIRPLIDIMMSGNSETVDYQLRMLFDAAESSAQYFRIQPDTYHADHRMDNAKPENLKDLFEAGRRNVTEYKSKLDQIVDILMEEEQLLL